VRAFGSLQAAIGRGMEKARFPYPNSRGGGGYGWGGGFHGGPWGTLPGSDYDYARSAGVTYLNDSWKVLGRHHHHTVTLFH